MKTALLLSTIVAALATLPAAAATFTAAHGITQGGPCNVSTSTGPFATGQVIAYAGSTCFGGYNVFLDTSARTITLTGVRDGNIGDYRWSEFGITGITGTRINTLRTVQLSPLFLPSTEYPAGPSAVLSYTADSISISFAERTDSRIFEFSNGGSAVFAYGVVPEPTTWAMMIVGFGLVGHAMRRRREPVAVA